MRQDYDNITKFITTDNPKPFTELILGYQNVTVLENLTTEQITLKSSVTDSTLRVQFPDEVAILHNEFQTYDSQEPMHYRIAGYNGFLIREYQLNVYTSVLYLHPQAGRNDPGFYEYTGNECEYRIRYRVIRLNEIDGKQILEAQIPSLLPLTPLMKPSQGMNPTQWLDECVDAMINADVDTDIKSIMFASMGIFGSLVYDMENLRQSFPDSFWLDFPLIQEYIKEAKERGLEQGIMRGMERGMERGLERGMERGQIIVVIDLILETLTDRFQNDDVQDLKPLLDEIDDIDRLKQLFKTVQIVDSLQEFRNMLNNQEES